MVRQEITYVSDHLVDDFAKTHLLTIFPVYEANSFARISCVALYATSYPCKRPYTCESAGSLEAHLTSIFTQVETNDLLMLLCAGETVYRQITDEDAQALGFQPRVH